MLPSVLHLPNYITSTPPVFLRSVVSVTSEQQTLECLFGTLEAVIAIEPLLAPVIESRIGCAISEDDFCFAVFTPGKSVLTMELYQRLSNDLFVLRGAAPHDNPRSTVSIDATMAHTACAEAAQLLRRSLLPAEIKIGEALYAHVEAAIEVRLRDDVLFTALLVAGAAYDATVWARLVLWVRSGCGNSLARRRAILGIAALAYTVQLNAVGMTATKVFSLGRLDAFSQLNRGLPEDAVRLRAIDGPLAAAMLGMDLACTLLLPRELSAQQAITEMAPNPWNDVDARCDEHARFLHDAVHPPFDVDNGGSSTLAIRVMCSHWICDAPRCVLDETQWWKLVCVQPHYIDLRFEPILSYEIM